MDGAKMQGLALEDIRNAHMYKKRPAKEIFEQNVEKRLKYGHTHKHDTIEDYWQFIA